MDNEIKYIEHLEPFCKRIEVCKIKRSFLRNFTDAFKSILLGKSFIISRDFVPEMQNIIDRVIKEEQPDFIHMDHLQIAQYIGENSKGIKVLDEHNVEYLIINRISKIEKNPLKKIFTNLEYKKLRKFEKDTILNSNLTLTVSEIDKKSLLDLTDNKANIATIPIGVDIEYFHYQFSDNNNQENNIIFIGTLFWPPNIEAVLWFYENVWDNIKNKNDESFKLTWKIIGLRPDMEILKLTEKDKNIEIISNADDVRPFMWEKGIFIVPINSGSGIRVKILNAMACGIPIVSTTIGAEGIEGLIPVISQKSSDTSPKTSVIFKN